ncbi:hypothetical protein GKR54_12335 [Providencia alcalifaciens]|uniref:hypothetical protein n=1 Tax=Providencia alcalifaciens TaxID=126385 RepID=UPI0012B6154E|nr:hypothetical protein [Providencia alcalifaciens]MTC31870.1 hypothetical protein [Providencia alcalifaciens]
MLQLIVVIVITTFVTVFAYKKMSSYMKSKGLSKGSIILVSFFPSALLYFFVYSILSMISYSLTSPTVIVKYKNMDNENVYLEFNEENPLEMSLYKSIKSYPQESFEFRRAILIYIDYGVSLKDFDEKVRPLCQSDFDKLSSWYGQQVKYWQQFPANVRNVEIEKAAKELVRRQKIIVPVMQNCYYVESQKLPNHIPRKPVIDNSKYYAK